MPVPSIGPLPMLDDTDLAFEPGPEIFAPLVNETLGNAGGPDDGFDNMFAAVASGYQSDADGLSDMDSHINAADFVPGAFDANEAAPVALDIVNAGVEVDSRIADLDSFANQQPPLSRDPSAASDVQAASAVAASSHIVTTVNSGADANFSN